MNLTEVQDRTYELLCLIDDICRGEGVRYFLDGGSESSTRISPCREPRPRDER